LLPQNEKALPAHARLSFNVVTFDLFGTLVDIDDNRLPCLTIDGVSVPSLLAAPFARLFELVPTMDLGGALVAYFQVGEELKSRPAPELDCEMPPYTHLIWALERIGVRDRAVVRDVVESQTLVTLQAARPAEGAVSLLKHLRDNGCSLGLVSNFADGDEGRDLLAHLKLTSYFDVVVFSGDVGWRKPDRRIFETTLSALHVEAREVLHIGDELRADIWGAGQCGMTTVWLNTNGQPFEGDHPPRLQIDRLEALASSDLNFCHSC
jgi:HAD superfamily hydrolase (TIGR01509 family)